jgi:hypothetical protein
MMRWVGEERSSTVIPGSRKIVTGGDSGNVGLSELTQKDEMRKTPQFFLNGKQPQFKKRNDIQGRNALQNL